MASWPDQRPWTGRPARRSAGCWRRPSVPKAFSAAGIRLARPAPRRRSSRHLPLQPCEDRRPDAGRRRVWRDRRRCGRRERKRLRAFGTSRRCLPDARRPSRCHRLPDASTRMSARTRGGLRASSRCLAPRARDGRWSVISTWPAKRSARVRRRSRCRLCPRELRGLRSGLRGYRPMTDQPDRLVQRVDRYAVQTMIGLSLAAAIMGVWLLIHVNAVFCGCRGTSWFGILFIIAVQTWLSVGLFIVAHDAMHGSLAPFPSARQPRGRAAGAGALCRLQFRPLAPKHFAHHRHPGRPTIRTSIPIIRSADPLVHHLHPPAFRLAGVRPAGIDRGDLSDPLRGYLRQPDPVLGDPVLSAFQLFYFGTYRPHRHDEMPFVDGHRARSEDFPDWLSLLTCFHFGHHHEHHDAPHVPCGSCRPIAGGGGDPRSGDRAGGARRHGGRGLPDAPLPDARPMGLGAAQRPS